MRSCSWCLMGLWLLKSSLALALALTLAMGLAALSAPQLAKTAAPGTPPELHHDAHAQHHMAADHTHHTDHADHTTSAVDNTTHKTSFSELDSTHCTAHADCHNCCPLAWGSWAGIGMQAAPTQPPARQVALWHSASWLPALRPPNA